MISEDQIEKVLQSIESDESLVERIIERAKNQNPGFFVHLVDENYIISPEEQDYFLGIMAVLLEASSCDLSSLNGGQWSSLEDANWSIWEKHKKLDTYFDEIFNQHPEEELLAFLEDSVVEDEDDFLTKVGREYIVLKAKTLIDFISRQSTNLQKQITD